MYLFEVEQVWVGGVYVVYGRGGGGRGGRRRGGGRQPVVLCRLRGLRGGTRLEIYKIYRSVEIRYVIFKMFLLPYKRVNKRREKKDQYSISLTEDRFETGKSKPY